MMSEELPTTSAAEVDTETKIIYYVDEESTPYMVKVNVSPSKVTLGDFKEKLNRPPNYRFFFKTQDADIGVVKEELREDADRLPLCDNGRVVSWLVSTDGSAHSDGSGKRAAGLGNTAQRATYNAAAAAFNHSANSDDTDSTLSAMPQFPRKGMLDRRALHPQMGGRGFAGGGAGMLGGVRGDESTMTSDSDTTGRIFSEDDNRSRVSTSTDITSVSRQQPQFRQRQKRRRKLRQPSRASSISSITESSMSLNIITVTLNMETVNFLGISIVGQSGTRGDGGIFVANIMKGGAVALDGRIEPNDMILQVNDISFESMSNDDAVRVLREATQKKGPIKLVVAKSFDPPSKGIFTIPRQEPVRPIDPGAWVAHTNAMRSVMPCIMEGSEGGPTPTPGQLAPPRPGSASTMTSGGGSGSDGYNQKLVGGDMAAMMGAVHGQGMGQGRPQQRLHVEMGVEQIVRAMAQADSGLEIKDRNWLKITIRNAFLGSELVDWLLGHVDGLADKKEARKLAARMLRDGFIKHTVNKITFSDQCYYVFGDTISAQMATLRLNGMGGPERPLHRGSLPGAPGGLLSAGDYSDQDTVAPLPPPPSFGHQPLWGRAAPSEHEMMQGVQGRSPSMVSGYALMPFQGAPVGSLGGSYPNLAPHHQPVSAPPLQLGTLPQAPPPPYPPAAVLLQQQQGPAPKSDAGGSGASNGSKGSGSTGGEGGSSNRKGSFGKKSAPPEIAPKPNLMMFVKAPPQPLSAKNTNGGDDRGMEEVPRDLASSRQSFRMAMNQPCEEFFVDYM